MKVITAGTGSTDIDSLACAVAYQEFLSLQREKVEIYISPKYTASVTNSIRKWVLPRIINADKLEVQEVEFILVDFSDYHKLLPFVDKNNVSKVFDHHFFGFEKHWQVLLGKDSIIEAVGSCASLIWREYRNAKLLEKMSQRSARYLYAAIISNTLNLQAKVTADLDLQAATDLVSRANLPKSFVADYYAEIESEVNNNPISILKSDTRLYGLNEQEWVIGQLELWDGKSFMNKFNNEVREFITSEENYQVDFGFITIPSIKEGINYIVPRNEQSKVFLTEKLSLVEVSGFLITQELLLREEIYKILNA